MEFVQLKIIQYKIAFIMTLKELVNNANQIQFYQKTQPSVKIRPNFN
jgi:hypothetical protein